MTPTSAVDGTTVGRDAFLDGVRAVLPAARERSAEAEGRRSLPPTTVADLERCGMFTGLQPRRWGGLELAPSTYFQGVVLLGSACGAAGWVGGVLGVHPWELACMHPDAQADVWAQDSSTRASSSYAPTGSARRVADGYLVEGVWRFSSGVDHASWALLAALVAGEEELGPRVFLIPRADFAVDGDSWHVSGLAGTGSRDVHVGGAIVPEHRTHWSGTWAG